VEEIIKSSFLKSLVIKINGKYIIYIAIQFLFAYSFQAQTGIVSKKVNTVVIDPGHGGRDPGAIGKVSKEKEIVLSLAQKLGKLINQRFPEVKVLYTRSDDRFVELYQRADIANKAKADLFISIHANSTTKQAPSGVEFWVLGLHKADENLEAVKKENAALQFEQDVRKNYGFDPNSPEGSIIMSMQQNLYLDQSIQLAKLMESRFVKEDNQLNRGSKQAGFIVLYKTTMPSVLVEVGFISNPDEEQYIANETGQTKIANNLANAFADYKLKYESGAIKQVSNATKEAPRTIIEPEVVEVKSGGFSSSTTGNKFAISPEDNAPAADIVKKESPQSAASNPPQASSLEQVENKKKIIVDDDIEKYSSVKTPNEKEILLTTSEPDVKSTPVVTSVPTKKTTSSVLEPKQNSKTIVTDDEIEVKKNQKLTSTPIVEKFDKKSTNSEVSKTAVEAAKKEPPTKERLKKEIVENTLRKVDEAPKSVPKINTATPGKIKIDENSNKVPSYIEDKEIKNEIIDNTKQLDKQKNILIENKIEVKEKVVTKTKPTSDLTQKPISVTNGLVYKVQVKAAASKIKSDDPIQEIKGLEESFEGGLYKYLVGNFTEEGDAKVQLEKVRSQGIKDAFIVKYKDGVRVK
jgi:N-acetylmuramoyl-L-alanine amidase